MSTPLISAVIPAFNARATIEDAIRSALRQTFSNVEVVVCDDASIDGTADAVRAINDARIRLIRNASNLGEGASRDRALDAAKGNWVAVLDADDSWHPNRLESLLQAAGRANDTLTFDNILICHDTSKGLRPWRAMRGRGAFRSKGVESVNVVPAMWARSKQFLIKPLIPAAFLRTSGVRHSNLRFGADTEFFLRLVANGARMRYVPVPLYYYRITPGSMSANPAKSRLMRDMLASVLPLFNDDGEMTLALEHKILYRDFTRAVKNLNIAQAAHLATTHPSFLPELVSRGSEELTYAIHRRMYRGIRRANG